MRYFITTIALFLALNLNAQQLEKQVIANTGSDVSAGGMQISQTVGEVTVQTFTSGSFILGQGFQQVEEVKVDTAIAIQELDIIVDYVLYPNPTIDNINVDLEIKNNTETLLIVIYNALGQQIDNKQVDLTQGVKESIQFNMSDQSKGLYFMNFYDKNRKLSSSIEFSKN